MNVLRGPLMVLTFALGIVTQVFAGDTTVVGEIEVIQPWARASISATRPTAAFFTVHNNGSESDSLISVSSPSAKMTHIHHTTMVDGAMIMSPVDSLEILPGQTITLKPGGLHVMLMKLTAPLIEGETTELVLTFENAGEVTITAPILTPGSKEMN